MKKSDWEIDVLDWNKWRGAVRAGCNGWQKEIIQDSGLIRGCCNGTAGTEINREHWIYIYYV